MNKMSSNNLCRICLEEDKYGEFSNIFSTTRIRISNENVSLNILVRECSSVIIEPEDPYPKLICTQCLKNLDVAYKFREQCIETDKKLRQKENLAFENEYFDLNTKSDNSTLSDHEEFDEDIVADQENIECRNELRNNFKVKEGKCFKSRKSKKSKNHQVNVKPFNCSYCHKSFKTETRKYKHEAIHTRRRIVCEICGKGFGHETNFEIHMRTHTGDKPYTCQVCGVAKTTEGDLKSHMKTHSDECKYSCHICGKQFKWLSNQLRHMRWHKGERTHKCNICGKLFFEASDVRKHMFTHTGEKPFKCTVCGRAFRRRGQLKEHCKVIHNITLAS